MQAIRTADSTQIQLIIEESVKNKYEYKMNVICPSCGAEFNKNLSQCPYCGNSNYYGQEKSYMKGLAGLRQRLAELADINKK